MEEREERFADSFRDEEMRLTIDASVFVSAARPSEELYPLSYRFLRRVKGSKIFCPNLVLAECGAAISSLTSPFLGTYLKCIQDFALLLCDLGRDFFSVR